VHHQRDDCSAGDYETNQQLRHHLAGVGADYNFARGLKTLRRLISYEFICRTWTKQPERFIIVQPIDCWAEHLTGAALISRCTVSSYALPPLARRRKWPNSTRQSEPVLLDDVLAMPTLRAGQLSPANGSPSRAQKSRSEPGDLLSLGLGEQGRGNGSGVMLLFVVRTLAPNRMR